MSYVLLDVMVETNEFGDAALDLPEGTYRSVHVTATPPRAESAQQYLPDPPELVAVPFRAPSSWAVRVFHCSGGSPVANLPVRLAVFAEPAIGR